jgi:hypothetical protein
MESQLERHSKQAMQIQEQKVQHEEAVVKLRHSERDMRNTLEKFAASIQVLCLCQWLSAGSVTAQQQLQRSILSLLKFWNIKDD